MAWKIPRRKFIRVTIAIGAIAAISIGALVFLRSQRDVDLDMQNAVRISEAAEACHRDHGVWPDLLEKLVPDYLPAVPAATGLNTFTFDVEAGKWVNVCFPSRKPSVTCCYTPRLKGWGLNGWDCSYYSGEGDTLW